MTLNPLVSKHIVEVAQRYVGTPFNYSTFNCVHFVRAVYAEVGIVLPLLRRYWLPPREFHLSPHQFAAMPLGHSVFFKRKATTVIRYWTHIALIGPGDTLIHCTRHGSNGVTVSAKVDFLNIYHLAPCL